MSEEFKTAYNKLSLNDKRNQLSDELLMIEQLIKNIEKKYNIPSLLSVKNYDTNKNELLTESEMLNFIYEDVYNIEKELITLLSVVDLK